jgi:hypothetical protein
MLKKSMLIGIFSVFILSSIGVDAQTPDTLYNQEFLNSLANYNFTNSTISETTVVASTTKSSEDIIYSKPAITNVNTNVNIKPKIVSEQNVYLDDILGVNITSKYSPSTPIEIFALTYKGDLTKKISIKTVYNETINVLKTYRLTVNKDLLDDMGNVDYFKVGFCVNGCKLIPMKMIIAN